MLSDLRGKGLAAHSLNPSFFFACKLQPRAQRRLVSGCQMGEGQGGARGQPGAGVTGTAVDG